MAIRVERRGTQGRTELWFRMVEMQQTSQRNVLSVVAWRGDKFKKMKEVIKGLWVLASVLLVIVFQWMLWRGKRLTGHSRTSVDEGLGTEVVCFCQACDSNCLSIVDEAAHYLFPQLSFFIWSICTSLNLCHFCSFPSSTFCIIRSIHPSAKPQNSASVITVNASNQQVVVARCESANGRPPATIKWITTANGEAKNASTAGTDNTVTVTSEYYLVPTSSDNGKDIICIVEHRTQATPERIPLTLGVQCKTPLTHNTAFIIYFGAQTLMSYTHASFESE